MKQLINILTGCIFLLGMSSCEKDLPVYETPDCWLNFVYYSYDGSVLGTEEVTDENAAEIFSDVSGILVPGGFGSRGIDGKIASIKYARENNIPFLGLCLGMQLSIVEFARDVVGFHDAHSIELNPATTHPVISLMPDQEGITDIGGTLRLGSYHSYSNPS